VNGIQDSDLNKIQKSIRYSFKNLSLLKQALTHRSYANEHPEDDSGHNERFEFLGDAVLNLVLSDLLLKKFPDLSEGAISKIRAGLVNEKKLAQIAGLLGLGNYLMIGRGEELTEGRQKPSLLGDALEAFLGVVFLDGGFKSASRIIHRLFQSQFETDLPKSAGDYKTTLQEYCQGKLKQVPTYHLVKEEGPDHKKVFLVQVRINDQVVGMGEGKTKKEAQQKAAQKALLHLGSQEEKPFDQFKRPAV
jgi:ribonuclease III